MQFNGEMMKNIRQGKNALSAGAWMKKNVLCYVYVVPVLLGILCFTLIPMYVSLNYSLHDYNMFVADPSLQLTNFGLQHYKTIFTTTGFWVSFLKSAKFAVCTVSVRLVGSYCLALWLNQKLKGISAFRVLYYLPVLIPGLVSTLLWADITDPTIGLVNIVLRGLGLDPYPFYTQAETVLPTIIMTGVTSWGGSMVMWLAQMKNVPNELYESADLDGANYLQKTFKITIPMTTSMVFYQLLTSIIAALQAFDGYYALYTNKSIAFEEFDFIVIRIYEWAWTSNRYSLACAAAWVLFLIIGIITAVLFKTNKWVYYGEEA